jgi:hypothetical protein
MAVAEYGGVAFSFIHRRRAGFDGERGKVRWRDGTRDGDERL